MLKKLESEKLPDIIFYDVGLDVDKNDSMRDLNYNVSHKIKELYPGIILIGMSYAIYEHQLPDIFDDKVHTDEFNSKGRKLKNILKKFGLELEERTTTTPKHI